MTDFNTAVQKTLANEGGCFQNPKTGEVCNYGITVWFLRSIGILSGSGQTPASADEIAFVRKLSITAAKNLYRQYFWDFGGFAALDAQALANKTFDLAVNMGVGTSVEMLQQALVDIGIPCESDGKLGPETAAAANAADQNKLYAAYIACAAGRYRAIAERDPELADDLTGWLDRLNAA